MIIVVPGNKLISIDSITPILLELFIKYRKRSYIVFFDKKTYTGVLNNTVIFNALNTCGHIIYIDKKSILSIIKLIYFYFLGFFGSKYIHFGLLDEGIVGLFWRLHRNNSFYSQKDSYSHNNLYYRNKLRKKDIIIKKPQAKYIIAFNEKMPELGVINNSKYVYMFGETRTRYEWLNYCKNFGSRNIIKYHQDILNQTAVIVYILGPFCEVMWLRDKNSYVNLFRDTMDVFKRKFPKIKVLLKPHVTTNLDIVVNEIGSNKQFEITSMHPSVLSYYASCFVSNLYSTTFADAYNLGVYTIEYSDYSDRFLSCTSGESVNPQYVDFFVNNNKKDFEQAVKKSITKKRKNILAKYNHNDDSGLIEVLSK